ncbi:hypothetical protein ACFQL1_18830 [Halomicroarcula sp. GCM10025709]|uniref:hypothetical protein n=1 Tax=Haloarcula TaxID=2237 RepID=UPI0024C24BBA|nr:hypothetical protein [Halomicroarcula sp. YJ-61-S]
MSQPDAPRQKSTLFCPDCGYESPAPMGWLEYTLSDQQHKRCPSCFALVARRATETPADTWDRGRDQVRSGFALWRASVSHLQQSVERLSVRG